MTTTDPQPAGYTYVAGDRCPHLYGSIYCGICETPTVAYNLREEYRLARLEVGDHEPFPRCGIPCPPWCQLEEGHPFDALSAHDEEPMRHHEHHFEDDDAPYSVTVESMDTLSIEGFERSEPEIVVLDETENHDVAAARAFARALEAAADFVEQLPRA